MKTYSKRDLPCGVDQLKPARKTAIAYVYQMPEPFQVDTLEGIMPGKANDWFICSVQDGEVTDAWLIDNDRFQQTYKEIDRVETKYMGRNRGLFGIRRYVASTRSTRRDISPALFIIRLIAVAFGALVAQALIVFIYTLLVS